MRASPGSVRYHGAMYLTIQNTLRILMLLILHLRLCSILLLCKDLVFRSQISTLEFRNGMKISVVPTIDDIRAVSESILMRQYGKPKAGDIVIDVGAYIGDFAVFAGWCGATVLAYEPMPDSLRLAKLNINQNSLSNRIKILEAAVRGNPSNDHVTIHYNPKRRLLASSFKPCGISKVIVVACITLEEIFVNNMIERCDLLKVDCEGCEYDILINCTDSILEKVKTIALEYHPIGGHRLEELVSSLSSSNFTVRVKPYPLKDKEGGGIPYAYRSN